MKQKILVLVAAAMLGLSAWATNIVISRNTGADMLQDIAVIGKWVFEGDDLQLWDKNGNLLATETIANIRKIVFTPNTTQIENITKTDIVVYPNPTQDILYIKGVTSQTLRVYDLQGRMTCINEGTEVNVQNLTAGTYLLQVGTQVVRFIKSSH